MKLQNIQEASTHHAVPGGDRALLDGLFKVFQKANYQTKKFPKKDGWTFMEIKPRHQVSTGNYLCTGFFYNNEEIHFQFKTPYSGNRGGQVSYSKLYPSDDDEADWELTPEDVKQWKFQRIVNVKVF